MAEEEKGALHKATEDFQEEMANKSPGEAIADDLGDGEDAQEPGGSPAGETGLTSGDPEKASDIPNAGLQEPKGQGSDTPGGPGVYREDKSD
ncbi:MAG: hypothetical protein H0U53_02735 [Actinobacteria bacterium]|nr:hypothetical protein [Actinomycetota bacterium]